MSISSSNTRSASTMGPSVVFIIAGIGLGTWLSLILVDVLTFWYLYSSTQKVIEGYGWAEYAAKLVAVAFASIISAVTPWILWNIIKLNQRWIPMLAGSMALWFVLMYVVQLQYIQSPFSPFNPFSGNPQKYYRDQNGMLVLMPKAANSGPYGEAVQDFDRAAAQEYQRQQGRSHSAMGSAGLWDRLWPGAADSPDLFVTVERVAIASSHTDVSVAVKRYDESKVGRLYPPQPGMSYLVDENGHAYDLVHDGASYETIVKTQNGEARAKEIRPDETYRFIITYRPLSSGITRLRMHDSRFTTQDIDHQLRDEQRRLAAEQAAREAQRAIDSVLAAARGLLTEHRYEQALRVLDASDGTLPAGYEPANRLREQILADWRSEITSLLDTVDRVATRDIIAAAAALTRAKAVGFPDLTSRLRADEAERRVRQLISLLFLDISTMSSTWAPSVLLEAVNTAKRLPVSWTPDFGSVSFRCHPTAELSVDGRPIPPTSAGRIRRIAAGRHLLVVKRKEYPEYSTEFVVDPSESKDIEVDYSFTSGRWIMR